VDDVTIARALHVVAVILWIGGVGFVTTVLLPSLRRLKNARDALEVFEAAEHRFGWQARLWTLVVGLSGLHMLARLSLWARFADPAYWWMHGMVLVWLVFTLVLFVAEPLVLGRWVRARAAADPQATFKLLERAHWILFLLSLVVALGAVAGAHGLLLFD
jgi:uncharacterized membrane protein